MGELRIGTCSWKYGSWHNLVYSAAKGINYLEEYARKYNTVEIDQWFWSLFGEDSVRLPRASDVQAYRASVPDDFRFTVKVPNSITLTHFYKKAKSDPLEANPYFLSPRLFETFVDALTPVHDMLGPLMFQFEYLNKQKMRSQQEFENQFEPFVGQVDRRFPLALETRNGNYLNRSLFTFLDRTGVSPVLLQGYWMPPVTELYEEWRPHFLRHEDVVVRLLGPDRKEMEERTGKLWHEIVAPRDEELTAIVDMVRDMVNEGLRVYLNVNNHYEGSAPLTIERVKRVL